jgi:hypothetical protein
VKVGGSVGGTVGGVMVGHRHAFLATVSGAVCQLIHFVGTRLKL